MTNEKENKLEKETKKETKIVECHGTKFVIPAVCDFGHSEITVGHLNYWQKKWNSIYSFDGTHYAYCPTCKKEYEQRLTQKTD
jgi:hypothetical protein